MPATPPVGNGLKMDVWNVAASVLMAVWPPDVNRSAEVATGRSVVFQLRLVLQIGVELGQRQLDVGADARPGRGRGRESSR